MAKLLELDEPDVNASDEEKPSGRLARHDGERAALRYKPVRTPRGEFLIVASQSARNDREVQAIGDYHGTGTHQWHRTRKAAQKDLYDRRKRDKDPDAGRSYFTEVTHVDPTDARRAKRARPSGELEREQPSGKLYRREDGEPAARRYMPVWNGKNFLIVAFQGDENRREVSKHGSFAGDPSGPRVFSKQQDAKRSLYDRLKKENNPDARKAFFTFVVHVDPIGTADGARDRRELSRARERAPERAPRESSTRELARPEHRPAERGARGGKSNPVHELAALAEQRGARFAIEIRSQTASMRGLSDSSARKFAAEAAEREAYRQAAKYNLGVEASRVFVDAFVGSAVSRSQLAASSGALAKGTKTGLIIAGAGVAVLAATGIAHMAMKSSGNRPA